MCKKENSLLKHMLWILIEHLELMNKNNQNFMLNLNGDFPSPCTNLAINSSKCTIRPEKNPDYDVMESPDYYSLHAGQFSHAFLKDVYGFL